ncbi:MAG: FtsX-like permease family protein [Geodermatophilaceae bacterium]|nr:FtsX-like permease family protein [Geodermatophilaceae bacterium]
MTNLLTVKLRRDLRATWLRLLLMVIAIAVSLTVFSGVLFTWSASARETRDAYLNTGPASATILLDRPIDAGRMAAIVAEAQTRPGVIEATGRTQFTSEIEVDGRLLENPLQVFAAAPDDPMRVATFEVQQGRWPPAPGEILLGRESLTLLDLAVGDTVVVTTSSGEPLRLRVSGVVYDPSLAPAPQEQRGHGYLSSSSLAASGEQDILDQVKIQVAEPQQPTTPSRDRDAIVAVAGDVGEWLQRDYGLVIREIQVPEPYAHPHQGQADALLISLLVGGAVALLLSTILVANMLNGLFTQQIPQIGILKAIGARSGRIARLYLAMTLIVAGAATLIALPLGILIGRFGASRVLGFLGIEADSLAAPWWTYAVVLAAGLILPPLMALIPLVRTSRTTVRAAIDHRGLGANVGAATGTLARLGRVRGLDRGLLMALRNTFRRPARFLLAVGVLSSAGVVFVAGMSTSDGVQAVSEEAKAQRQWDVDVQLASPTSMDEIATLLEQAPNVSRVEGLNVAETSVAGPQQIPVSRTYPDQGHGRVAVTTVPAGTTMFTPPKLRKGRWLNPGETGVIVLNQITVANTVPGTGAGDTVELSIGGRPTTWRVVGIVEERVNGGAYVTAEGFAGATGQPPRVNQLRIATDSHDEQTRTAVAGAVDEILTANGVEVRSTASVSQSDAATEGHLGPIILIVLAISIAMAVIGGIGLASTMSANVLERTREFGVMHAIGARPKAVRRIVVAEGVFLALVSCLVAVIPTLGLTMVMGEGLGNLFMYAPLPFRISLLAAGIWIILVVLGAVLATEAAATRASRLTVREALAYV